MYRLPMSALSNDDGMVEIEWHIGTTPLGRQLTLIWREKRGPTVTAPTRTSFGTQLIKSLLVSEVGGVADIVYEPSGIKFVAKITLD